MGKREIVRDEERVREGVREREREGIALICRLLEVKAIFLILVFQICGYVKLNIFPLCVCLFV